MEHEQSKKPVYKAIRTHIRSPPLQGCTKNCQKKIGQTRWKPLSHLAIRASSSTIHVGKFHASLAVPVTFVPSIL